MPVQSYTAQVLATAKIREAEFDFLAVLRSEVAKALADDEPKHMRELAQRIYDVETRVKSALQNLQGQLNGKAFGR